MQGEVRHGIRDGRMDRLKQGGDDIERSDAHRQGDIELALLQMRAETVRRIDAALGQLEAGSCVECAKEIAERRLRALPFAVRYQAV
jgi:RNA polymerase-binding transcription factor DksA